MASPSAATPAAATRAEDAPPPGHRTPAAGPAHKPPGASPAASESPLRPGKENSTPGSDERSATLALAREKYNRRDFAGALACCQAAGCADDDAIDSLLLLGAVHFQLGRWEDCARHTLRCIKRAPGVAESYSNLANALKELGDPRGAKRLYLKAIALKPRFTDAYNNLASAHLHLGETREALETYEAALLVDPSLAETRCHLGHLHRAAGRRDVAEHCYAEALACAPNLAAAWCALAAIYKERGRLDDAAAYYREAIRRKPSAFDAHSNLGNVLKEQGKVDAAIAEYARAIELNPGFAVAHGNLASCYFEKGDLERAIRIFRVALDIEPNFPDACNNLGNALREHGDLEEAIACYRRALLLRPDHAHAHNNLGNAMKDKGLVNEAIQCYATAVGLAPRFAAAHSNLGLVLKERGTVDDALAHYREAIAVDPQFADAYSNMGNAYKDLGRLDDAIRCYGEALKLRPDFADACSNLAAAYKDGGRHAEAVACYRRALELKPDFSDAFSNLAHSLVFVCDWSTRAADFERLTRIVRDQLAAAKPAVVDVDPAAPLKPGHRRFGGKVYPPEAGNVPSVQPFHTLVYPVSISDMRAIAERYADRAALQAAVLGLPEPLCDRLRPEDALRLLRETPDGARYGDAPAPGDGRLRLGYCSSDLGNHPLAHLMQSVFGMHDRSKFHVTCFALSGHDGSPWRRKIEAEVERFVDLSTASPRDCALAIRARAIDVLVNLNGYTKGARNEIFALRPAPIQVSYMGFCGTLGADYVQYVVADAVVVPRDHARHYSEKVCRVPHSYFVNDHAQSASYIFDAAALPKRADYGVPERASFVFCNFNQIYKIDPGILDVWCRILTRVDGSILWLLRFPPTGEANIRAEARKRGVSDDRIHFTAVSAKDEHIKRGVLADLFLDTPQCNAHTTGCDILWGGCPMVTCLGGKMATRVAASLLGAAGLADLVAPDLGGYEELAVALATDKERYAAVRRRAEACRAGPSRAPLWDTLRWVRNVERGYGAMWATHEAGLPPADIDVDDVGADGFDRTAYAPAALGPLPPPPGCPARAAPQPPQRPPQPIQPPGLAALGPVGPHVAGVLFPPAPLFPPPFPAYGAQLRQPTYFLHQGNAVPPQRLPTPPAHYLQTPNAGFALYPPAALNQTDHVWSPRMHQPVFATRPPPRLPGEYAPFG